MTNPPETKLPAPAGPTRREVLKLAAATAAAGPFFLFSPGASGQQEKTLKIAKWAHFIPEYDTWFEGVLAKEWGRQHGTEVVVSHIPVEEVAARAAAEAAARQGHDLFMFPWPPAQFGPQVIDHNEIYQAVSFRHGSIDRLGHKSTYDPVAKKYFAFADSWMPAPFHYYEDWWRKAGMQLGPLSYGSLRSGGKRLRAELGIPCGLAVTPSLEGNVTLHTLLHGFGAHVLDAAGNVIINKGARTLAALRYVKALVEEAGDPAQLGWKPAEATQAMVARKTSCTVSAISLLRAAERDSAENARRMRLSPPLLGSAGVIAVPHVTNCSVVWKFAANQAGAKQFLVDLIDRSKTVYEQSLGCNFPIYQKTVPDLIVRLENDPRGDPPYKYKELKDALHWTANLGFPGFAHPVAMESWSSFVIPRMFLKVVKGEQSPEDAARSAEAEINHIADQWKSAALANKG